MSYKWDENLLWYDGGNDAGGNDDGDVLDGIEDPAKEGDDGIGGSHDQDGDGDDLEDTGTPVYGSGRYTPYRANEVFATVSENFELHSGTASVQIRCAWNMRYQVVKSFLEGGDRQEPTGHPFWNNFNQAGTPLIATSVRIEPMQTKYSVRGQSIVYRYALITLNYSMMATEVKVDSTNQYLTIAPNNLYWMINGAPIAVAPEEAPGIRLASYDLTLSHPHIRCFDENGDPLQMYEGYCNENAIQLVHNGVHLNFAPQTLLCTAPSISAGANLFGSGFNNISVRLSYNPLGHNEFFNPLQGQNEVISNITAHKVKMYKHIAGTGSSSTDSGSGSGDSGSSSSGDSGSSTGGDSGSSSGSGTGSGDSSGNGNDNSSTNTTPAVTGTFQQVLIYPTRDFIPLFKAFKINVFGGNGAGGEDGGHETTSPDGTTYYPDGQNPVPAVPPSDDDD